MTKGFTMARKKTQYKPPYLLLTVHSNGNPLLNVTSGQDQANGPRGSAFKADMRVWEGVDRLAVATTLVEVAADLIKASPFLNDYLRGAADVLIVEALTSADTYIERHDDEIPF